MRWFRVPSKVLHADLLNYDLDVVAAVAVRPFRHQRAPFGPRGSTVSGRQSRLYEVRGSILPVFVFTSVTTLFVSRSTVTKVTSVREASALFSSALIASPQACFV